MTTTNNFDSEQFVNFLQNLQKENSRTSSVPFLKKLEWLDSTSNQQDYSIQEQLEFKKKQTATWHKRVTNNGKGLIRFSANGEISTQDERLRLAIYQSTYNDSDSY